MSRSRKNIAVVVLLLAFLVASVGCHTSSSNGDKKPFSLFSAGPKTPTPKKPAPEFSTVPDFVGGKRPDFF